VEKTAAEAVNKMQSEYCAFTASQIMVGQLPQWSWTQLIYNGFNLKLGGNLMIADMPGWYNGDGTGTGHGTPWKYDTHVPLILRGPGISPGHYYRNVGVPDLAATISQILGTEYPTGCIGQPLREALGDK